MSIYKYMKIITYDKEKPVNLLKSIFEDNTLRFSSPLTFNDPFEFRPYIKNLIAEKDDIVGCVFSSHINHIGEAHNFFQHTIEDLLEGIGTLCLSGTNKNLTMWGHYADNHKGVVIEFDKDHKYFSIHTELDQLHELKEVIYVDERFSVDSNQWAEDEKTYLAKSKYWEKEEEYRMTIYLDERDKYNIKFPPEIIKSIYIGCKTNPSDIEYIRNLKNQDRWKHLKIVRFEMDEKEYKLVPKEVKAENKITK